MCRAHRKGLASVAISSYARNISSQRLETSKAHSERSDFELCSKYFEPLVRNELWSNVRPAYTGQASIEAMLCFAAFLALLGVMVAVAGSAAEKAKDSASGFWAKVEAERCASLADALYASGSGMMKNAEVECFVSEQGVVSSTISGITRDAVLVNPSTKTDQTKTTGLVVEVSEHYR